MPRISVSGYRDPIRRPRFIVWTVVAVIALAAIVIVALGVTSTRWFCAEGCHKVQDDTIKAYERSTHAEISCMACHMPVGSTPIVFLLHKAEALGELYLTVTDNFELPLNAESEVALTMPSTQCTQCHNPEKRTATPTEGILIDHKVHEENEVSCSICHNRIAHNENFKLTLTDPESGRPNTRHEQFMTMTACFRCHSQGKTPPGGLEAPGKCSACHPPGFQLKPPSHLKKGFFPEGHAKLASIETSRARLAEKAEASAKLTAEEGGQAAEEEELGPGLPKVQTINECYTCHSEKFCVDCHGVPMPHPEDFKETHGAAGKKDPEVCANCHGDINVFCDECHHGASMNQPYTAGTNWRKKHPATVAQVGASACFECHNPTFCANCHVNGTPD